MPAILKFLNNSAKLCAVGGFMYLTYKCGVWSDNYSSRSSFNTLRHSIVSKSCDIPSRAGEIAEAAKSYWNGGVNFTFDHISRSPEYAKKGIEYMKLKAKDF